MTSALCHCKALKGQKKKEGCNERKSKMICEWKVCPWGWKWPIFESQKKKGVGVVISGVLIEGHLQINANKVKLVNWGLYPRDRELSDSNKGIKRRKPALWLECLLRLNRVFVQSCWVKVPNVHFSHCLIFPVCLCLIVYCRATFYWLRGKLVGSLFAKQS